MAINQYFDIIKRWWWLLLASTLVASVSAFVAVSREPRIYQAATTVVVGQSLQQADPSSQDIYISQQLAQTYREMVTRQPILRGVQEALGLSFVPWYGNISARLVPGTQFLEISVRDTVPERAAGIADEIANQLIVQSPNNIHEEQEREAFVREQIETLQAGIQQTQLDIQEERAKLASANSARAIQQYQANIDALESRLRSDQATYSSLLQTTEGRTNYLSIFERATIPTRPVSPNVPETILMAAAIGLVLALGGAFLIEFLDDTVKTPDDMARTAELPMLGSIAHANGKEGGSAVLIAAEMPRSPITEAYRSLRTNIQVSSVDKPVQTLVVTSANPGEGKTTIAANLGVVFAQAGKSTILVDADLRRATLHKLFNLQNREGLTSALLMDEPVANGWLLDTGVENLRLLTSGPLPPNPAELLGSQKMHRLVERLKEEAEVIIFDAPPILPVTDAAVLALEADGVIVVGQAGRTRRGAARKAVENLRQVEGKVLGGVLNCVHWKRSDGYYYTYYE
jgi:polysaccharide biosynthesis transport protein